MQVALKKCQRVNFNVAPSPSTVRRNNASEHWDPKALEEALFAAKLAPKPKPRQKVRRSRTIHAIDVKQTFDTSSARLRTTASMNTLCRQFPSSGSKRPSLTWIPYQSPRKGLLTTLAILGTFVLSWLPFASVALATAFEFNTALWPQSVSRLILLTTFVSHPLLYGLMNRAIRSEIAPALCPPRNLALEGLPRKNSQRRISVQSKYESIEKRLCPQLNNLELVEMKKTFFSFSNSDCEGSPRNGFRTPRRAFSVRLPTTSTSPAQLFRVDSKTLSEFQRVKKFECRNRLLKTRQGKKHESTDDGC